MKKCGYSFWGYLGDVKMDEKGHFLSTPDGNAFYSWSIIKELMNRGYEVTQIMPDRDRYGNAFRSGNLFVSWAQQDRARAYYGTKKVNYYSAMEELLSLVSQYEDCKDTKAMWWEMEKKVLSMFRYNFRDMEFILHEYRMLIPGRNDIESTFNEGWQPDFFIQHCIVEYCRETGKKLIVFDLDYKFTEEEYRKWNNQNVDMVVLELGSKWEQLVKEGRCVSVRQVYIPFDFDHIHDIDLPEPEDRENKLVYVGNRYERDWCIDKYISEDIEGCTVYGNWLEGNRDSKERWPNIKFGKRLQTGDMKDVYRSSAFTILFAKREYCENGFMTARIVESIFYGSVPLFIEEYGSELIEKYAGDYAELLTVKSANDVCAKINTLRNMSGGAWINIIIDYMRDRLRFMDVRNFVDILMEVK